MDRRGYLVLQLAVLYVATIIILELLGEGRLDVYLSLLTLEYLVSLALYSPFPSSTQKALNLLGALLFAVFLYFVTLRVLEILVGV